MATEPLNGLSEVVDRALPADFLLFQVPLGHGLEGDDRIGVHAPPNFWCQIQEPRRQRLLRVLLRPRRVILPDLFAVELRGVAPGGAPHLARTASPDALNDLGHLASSVLF